MEIKYPQFGEIWEHKQLKVQVKVIFADNINKDIFGKVIVKPLDGGSEQKLTILDFLDNDFVYVRDFI
jgi:hypothetical protein